MSDLNESNELEFSDEVGAEVTKGEVEQEILDAREEVLKEEESQDGCFPEKEVSSPWVSDNPVTESEDFHQEFQCEPHEETQEDIRHKIRQQKILVAQLRKADDVHNRTCAQCMKRLPIEYFRRLKQSQLCAECEG